MAWQARCVYTSLHTPGSFAHYTPVATRALMLVPPDIDFATAASLPGPALTAWLALDKYPRARARVLISGAGGALGLFALQLALKRGFKASKARQSRRQWPGCHAGAFYAVIALVRAERGQSLAMARMTHHAHRQRPRGPRDGWRPCSTRVVIWFDPAEANECVQTHQLDLAMMGRAHLADPHYPFAAARALNVRKPSSVLPAQYAYWLARYPGPQNGYPVD